MTAFPQWVYEQYDERCLVEKVHNILGNSRIFSFTDVAIPREPKELSFWLASNLPLDDKHKIKLLGFNCAIRRLRYEISLMEQVILSIEILVTLNVLLIKTNIFMTRLLLYVVVIAARRSANKMIFFPCQRRVPKVPMLILEEWCMKLLPFTKPNI